MVGFLGLQAKLSGQNPGLTVQEGTAFVPNSTTALGVRAFS